MVLGESTMAKQIAPVHGGVYSASHRSGVFEKLAQQLGQEGRNFGKFVVRIADV
jgi:hypothetical protein